MLDNLPDLLAVLRENADRELLASRRNDRRLECFSRVFEAEAIYCSKCGAHRRVDVHPIYHSWDPDASTSPASRAGSLDDDAFARGLAPAIFGMRCLQCSSRFTAVLYVVDGPSTELAVFPARHGGITTPHTPDGVAYYLGQAHRAQTVGANSSAVAMYRAALEHLLYEQGYTSGMCGAKLNALKADIAAGKAPKWATELDPAFLMVLNQLGNGAIHPNDGDVGVQAELDSDLLALLGATFEEVLNEVYERSHVAQSRLNSLQQKVAVFNQKHTSGTATP